MKKLIGLSLFLLLLYVALLFADPSASSLENHQNLAKRIGIYGVISLGVAPLIISGGIDLSIGSVIGLCATLLAMLVNDYQWNPHLAVATVLGMGVVIGLINGILVTKLQLQPFVVTLCGLMIYRSLARWVAGDGSKGVGRHFDYYNSLLFGELLGIPKFFIIFVVLAVFLGIVVHLSVYGRYWQAIGANEKTAYYSGIRVDRYKILAYVISSLSASIFAIMYITENRSSLPATTGSFFELYAIAGAVLGGISLRGGEGTILGVFIGTTIMRILPNITSMWGIKDALQDTLIGAALLVGAILDAYPKYLRVVVAYIQRKLTGAS